MSSSISSDYTESVDIIATQKWAFLRRKNFRNILYKEDNLGPNGYCGPNSILISNLIKDTWFGDVCSYEDQEEIIFLCSV